MRNSLTLMVTSLVIVFLLTISFIVVHDANKYQLQQEGNVLQAQTSTATLTCSQSTITLTTQDQQLSATLKNASGKAMDDRAIAWTSTIPSTSININPASDRTNQNGVSRTTVKARNDAATSSTGIITAMFKDNTSVICQITVGGNAITTTPTETLTPDPSMTVSPSPEDPGNLGNKETRLAFTVFLHGIGKGGDNQNPGSVGNENPRSRNIPIVIDILRNSDLGIEKTQTIAFTYDTSTGGYKAVKDFKGLPEGRYRFRIKAKKYLETITLQAVQTRHDQKTDVPEVFLETGDINDDGHRNILDYNILSGCYSDLEPPDDCDAQRKLQADLTDDLEVNIPDYNLFLRELFR